ncbi:MAG: nucleoside recognition domain-containing protein [Bacillota bacterium]
MDWISFVREAAGGSIKNIAIMMSIIVPIMILLEMARELKLLERISKKLAPALKVFGMSPETAFPLIAGIFFGISYGAGVIIDAAKSGKITLKDMILVNVFLSVCHAVVEDTALFLALGANPWVILPGRLAAAVLITYLAASSGFLKRYDRAADT